MIFYYYLRYLKKYLSPPGLSWNAILEMTKIKLELITNCDMYRFFEKKEQEFEFLIFLIIIVNSTINV